MISLKALFKENTIKKYRICQFFLDYKVWELIMEFLINIFIIILK